MHPPMILTWFGVLCIFMGLLMRSSPMALSIVKKIRLSDFQSRILQTSGIRRGLILQFLSRTEYIMAREITIRVLYQPLSREIRFYFLTMDTTILYIMIG
jgi:hypothetical protein